MAFDLRAARYFIAVAEELHFGRAATRLLMSQPPLSQAIQRLERDVGATLLLRTNRSVALTPAGDAFLSACRRLVEHARDVEEVPRLVARGGRQQVRIGAVASALQWPLPQAIVLLRQRAPDLSIRMYEIDPDEVVPGLNDGSLDVAVARLAASRTRIRTRIMLREEFVLIAPPGHALGTSSGDLAALSDEQWVGISREVSSDYHDEMIAVFRGAGISPRMHHSSRSIASQIAMVAAGAGIALVPGSATRGLSASVDLHRILSRAKTVTLSVSTRLQRDADEQLVEECLEKVARDEPEP